MKIKLFVPNADAILDNANSHKDMVNRNIYQKLTEVYSVFSCVKTVGDDELRETWLEVERGPMEAFGDFEELKESGEVETMEDFEQLWKDYYPEETKWYKFQTAKYEEILYFYFGGKLLWSVKETEFQEDDAKEGWNLEYYERFAGWLLEKITDETDKLKKDVDAYNSYIQQNLPWSKQLGKILRKDFWEIMGTETIRPDLNLGNELIEKLKMAVTRIKENQLPLLPEMTANMFFRVCEIGYDANGYFKNRAETLLPRDKYLSFADGRDAGLRDIDGDSPEDFNEWYHGRSRMGAHPWEICRGGNSTHISLFVINKNGKWIFDLAGSSIVRVEETVRMAVAMYENEIPFELRDADEIVRMVTGEDFIGIVPDKVFPRYCHSLFPGEDRIIDFMNLGWDKEIVPAIVEKAQWYPLDRIAINSK
jgi:hypothetical protein